MSITVLHKFTENVPTLKEHKGNDLFYCDSEHLCLYFVAGEEMDHGSNL